MTDDGKMATVKVLRPRVSYADLERWPEDGRRYELYDGEVFVVPSPLPIHQVVGLAIVQILDGYARAHGGRAFVAPLDIVLSEFDVVQPDVIFFQASRSHLVDLNAPIRHAPDIAVEVISPSTASIDRGKKAQLLARYGVPEYWIADPVRRQLEVYSLSGGAYTLTANAASPDMVRSALLPDLVLDLVRVFP